MYYKDDKKTNAMQKLILFLPLYTVTTTMAMERGKGKVARKETRAKRAMERKGKEKVALVKTIMMSKFDISMRLWTTFYAETNFEAPPKQSLLHG